MKPTILEEAIMERDELRRAVESYNIGDRPMPPPASLLRDLIAAEQRVIRLQAQR